MTSIQDKLFSNKYILASQSPRRSQLLKLVGIDFDVVPSSIDENIFNESDPQKHVVILATAKAQQVAQQIDKGIIIGADTIVVLDNFIIGKPENEKNAKEMLQKLSGKKHKVVTGFTILEKPSKRQLSDFEVTSVFFRNLAEWEIDRYIQTKSPLDKAGAYGIQDQSAIFVDKIEGCFYNVVGFPLTKFYRTLINFVHSR